MDVSALHHIGYVVPRIGPALSRFTDDGATILVEPIDDPIQRVTVALLACDADVPIELVAPMAGVDDAPVMSRLRRGGGMDHLCFVIDDVATALEQEADRGGLVVCEPVFAVAFARTIGFVQRRSGLVVEYISKEEVSSP